MDILIGVSKFIAANWQTLLLGLQGVLVGLIAIFAVIPGDQPEKTLQAIVDVIKRFSVKKGE